MLDSHGGVEQHQHRLALDLGIAVRHGNRRFFVTGGKEFRLRIVAVVDQGFVQAREAGARIRHHILKIELLQHVDHVVRTGAEFDPVDPWDGTPVADIDV
jgi:hypothetical protein